MNIEKYIEAINNKNEKVLSVFLTAGYPNKEIFTELAVNVFNAGADLLEIGIPFSDPLADGPVIQHSSNVALNNGVTIKDCLNYVKEIKTKVDKPILLMSYINPILSYGIEKFFEDAKTVGVNGLIIPDLVIEEYDELIGNIKTDLEVVMLCTPTTPNERIKEIDSISKGFIYTVSLNGTTGDRTGFNSNVLEPIKNAYSLITKNKMLVGFGISNAESVKYFSPYCDGVIVGSAIVKMLENLNMPDVLAKVKELKEACKGGR